MEQKLIDEEKRELKKENKRLLYFAQRREEIKEKLRKSVQEKISSIETELNATIQTKLCKKYGKHWLKSSSIPRIHKDGYVFISNQYIPLIEKITNTSLRADSL